MNANRVVGLLILIAGLALCGKGLWLLFIPSSYEAMTKIEIESDVVQDVPSGENVYQPYDPYFIETELKAMQGDIVLSNVVEALNLDAKWNKQYGRRIGMDEAVELLKRSVVLDADRNTRIVLITAREHDPNEAAQVANAIVDAYRKYRTEQHRAQMEAGIEKLEEDYRFEETNIFLGQSNVGELRKELGIRDTDPSSTGPTLDTEQVQYLNQTLIEQQANYIKLQTQFAEFRAIQSTNPVALAGVLIAVFPDAVLSDLLGKLDENEQQLVELRNFHGTNNVEVEAALSSKAALEKEIRDRTAGMMIGLEAMVNAQKDTVDAVKQKIADATGNSKREAARGKPYWEAKRALLDKEELHQLLGQKIEMDNAHAMNPRPNSLVKVVEPAVAPKAPAAPNHWQGGVCLLCGMALAGLGFCLLRSPKPQAQ